MKLSEKPEATPEKRRGGADWEVTAPLRQDRAVLASQQSLEAIEPTQYHRMQRRH